MATKRKVFDLLSPVGDRFIDEAEFENRRKLRQEQAKEEMRMEVIRRTGGPRIPREQKDSSPPPTLQQRLDEATRRNVPGFLEIDTETQDRITQRRLELAKKEQSRGQQERLSQELESIRRQEERPPAAQRPPITQRPTQRPFEMPRDVWEGQPIDVPSRSAILPVGQQRPVDAVTGAAPRPRTREEEILQGLSEGQPIAVPRRPTADPAVLDRLAIHPPQTRTEQIKGALHSLLDETLRTQAQTQAQTQTPIRPQPTVPQIPMQTPPQPVTQTQQQTPRQAFIGSREMPIHEVVGDSLMAGVTQASANVMNVPRTIHRAGAELLDWILPESIYDIEQDPIVQAGDRMMQFYDDASARQQADLKNLRGARQFLSEGLQPLPQVVLSAMTGLGITGTAGQAADLAARAVAIGKSAVAAQKAGKAAEAARLATQAAQVQNAANIATQGIPLAAGGFTQAFAKAYPNIVRMLPFGALAASGAAREAGKEGANFTQQVFSGVLIGAGEMVSEAIPFEHALRVIDRLGVTNLVEQGSRNLIQEFGAAGIDYLKAGVSETLQEAAMVPWSEYVQKSIYAPETPWLGEGGVFNVQPIVEGGMAGLAMSVVLGALGLPATAASHVRARRAIREQESMQELIDALEKMMPKDLERFDQQLADGEFQTQAQEQEQEQIWEQAQTQELDWEADETRRQEQAQEQAQAQAQAQEQEQAQTQAQAQEQQQSQAQLWEDAAEREIVDEVEVAETVEQQQEQQEEEQEKTVFVANIAPPQSLRELQEQFIKASPREIGEEKAEALGALVKGVSSYKKMTPDEYIKQRFRGVVAGGTPADNALFKEMEDDDRHQSMSLEKKDYVPPQRTIKAYKLFRTLKNRPGEIFPLFIGKTKPTPVGEWIPAEHLPTKGYAERPGWHAGELPLAPHLMKKDGTMQEGRVWAEIEMPADVDWQELANKTTTKDIRDRVPEGGHYRFKTSKMQGGAWLIGGAIRVNRILSTEEVNNIVQERVPEVFEKIIDGERIASVEFDADAKALIRALKSPNVAVMVHELGHIFRRDLSHDDLAIAEQWAGVTDGAWNIETEERFADGFVEYLEEGKPPTPQLKTTFEKFKEWLSSIFQSLSETHKNTLSSPIREVFNRLLGETPQPPQPQPPAPAEPQTMSERLSALWEGAQGDNFARKRLYFMTHLPDDITRTDARQWMDRNIGHEEREAIGMPKETEQELLQYLVEAHDPNATGRGTRRFGNISLDISQQDISMALMQLGRAAVPGIRWSDADTAGTYRMLLHTGVITQQQFDDYVQGAKDEGRVSGILPKSLREELERAQAELKSAQAEREQLERQQAQRQQPPQQEPPQEPITKKEAEHDGREEVPARVRGTGRDRGDTTLEEAPPEDVRGAGEAGEAGRGGVQRTGADRGDVRRSDQSGDAVLHGTGEREGELDIPAGRREDADTGRDERPAGRRPGDLGILGDSGGITAQNYRITEQEGIEDRSVRRMTLDNVAAIRLMKQLLTEGRQATAAEQETLVKYAGWGFNKKVFSDVLTTDDGYNDVRRDLKEILTQKEWEHARASAQFAHYTSAPVIRAMYNVLERLGFHGGRVLEPAMGVGHFFGLMPAEMERDSWLTGVEIESITGNIAKLLYPRGSVNIMGYQNFDVPYDKKKLLRENYFDLVISNVPFSKSRTFRDPRYEHALSGQADNLHNYFFVKGIDQVRPGGLMAFITSHYTMDAAGPQTRDFRNTLTAKADFLGAVRLHNEAFKDIAETRVVTDVIFMQKREEGTEPSANSQQWASTVRVTEIEGESYLGQQANINEYYVNNPEMVLGKQTMRGKQYRDDEYTVEATEETKDLERAITRALAKLPENIYLPPPQHQATEAITLEEMLPAEPDAFPGSFIIKNGVLMQTVVNEEGKIGLLSAKKTLNIAVGGTVENRIKGMIELRSARDSLVALEFEGTNDKAIEAARKKLNKAYDEFIRVHGSITNKANALAFKADPSYYKLAALENVNEDTGTITKADMFTKRTIRKFELVSRAETPQEALAITLNERGRVDLEHMSSLTGESQDRLKKALSGLIYNDPEIGWVTADEYLSGNVRAKLKVAEDAVKHDAAFKTNVEALKEAQPPDLRPEDIYVTLGSHWIPVEDYRDFIAHLFNVSPRTITVRHVPQAGIWEIDIPNKRHRKEIMMSAAATTQWGTPEMDALEIIEKTFAKADVKVTETVETFLGKKKTVVKQVETIAAKEKQDLILKEFTRWLWQGDAERQKRLVRKYNDEENNLKLREFNGEHLTFPGMNPNITLSPHQKRAVWRAIQGRSTLFAHTVGAGKTFELVASAMELKRLGIIKKAVLVSPNHLIGQTTREAALLYPAANILHFDTEAMNKANRKKTTARIATGDWDLIIMPESSFGMLPMSANYVEDFIDQELAKLDAAMAELAKGENTKGAVGKLNQARAALETKLRKQLDRLVKNQDAGFMTFEESGIDALFVDESHEYKNLFYFTKMDRVGGLGTVNGSLKAFDMLMKTDHIRAKRNGSGIVFASGTPVSNTMAELYHLQRYLDPQALKNRGIHTFDAWAHAFGRVVTALELKPTGKGFQAKQRFAEFVNAAELLQMYRSFADIVTHESLVKILGDAIKLPKPVAGGRMLRMAQASPELLAYIDELQDRADAISRGGVNPKEDNMLNIMNDGRLVALYPPLRGVPDYADSKVHIASQNIFNIWESTKQDRSTQLAFLDLSVPKGRSGVQEQTDDDVDDSQEELVESVYAVMRNDLLKLGVPANEIAFIHDYKTDSQKLKLYDAVNAGRIRILLGSTKKMGVGMNVQKRLIALHHIDAPWRPSDIGQREGRIIRRGNLNEEVMLYAYGTESTLDSLLWQILETKQKFITQIETDSLLVRSLGDVDEVVFSFAQFKAALTGNPAMIEYVEMQNELTRLLSLEKSHTGEQIYANDMLRAHQRTIEINTRNIADITKDIAKRKDTKGDKFSIVIDGKTYDKRADATAALEALAKEVEGMSAEDLKKRGFEVIKGERNKTGHRDYRVKVGTFAGGNLWLQEWNTTWESYVEYTLQYRAKLSMQSIEHAIGSMERHIEHHTNEIESSRKEIDKYSQIIGTGEFPQAVRLNVVRRRLEILEVELGIKQPDLIVIGDDAEGLVLADGTVTDADAMPAVMAFEGMSKKRWRPKKGADARAKQRLEQQRESRRLKSIRQLARKEKDGLIRRRDIILKLMDIIETPLRTGKVRVPHAIGIFKHFPDVIRVKGAYAEDVRVVFHEAGHKIDMYFSYELTNTSQFDDELLETEYVAGLKEAKPKTSDETLRKEGLAEFFYYFLSDPQKAKDDFPAFYDYFLERLQGATSLYTVLQEYQDIYAAYEAQDPVSKMLSAVGEPRRQRFSFSRSTMRVISGIFDDLHAGKYFSKIMSGGQTLQPDEDYYTLARLSRGSAGKALVLLNYGQYKWLRAEDDADLRKRAVRRVQGVRYVFTKVGPSLKEIATEADAQFPELTAYLIAERARELEAVDLPALQEKAGKLGISELPDLVIKLQDMVNKRQTDTQEYKDLATRVARLNALDQRIKMLTILKDRNIVSGMDMEAAEEVHNMYKDNKKFNELQRQLRDWWSFLVQDSVDAGLVSAENAKLMQDMHMFYVPFKRVRDDDEWAYTGLTKQGFANLPSPIKRIYGSGRSIRNIWDQAARDSYFYYSLNDKNRATRALADLADQYQGMGAIMEKLPTPLEVTKIHLIDIKDTLEEAGFDTKTGRLEMMATIFSAGRKVSAKQNTIVIFRNGSPEFYQLDPDLYRSVMALDEESVSKLAKLMRPFAQLFRTSAVLNPRFIATNPWRDQSWTATIEKDFTPFISLGQGLASIAEKDDWYIAFKASGGAHSALANFDEYKHPEFTMRMRDKIKKFGMNLVTLGPLRGVSGAMEESTKVAVFRRKLEKGHGLTAATFAARNSPVDFSVKGGWTKLWRTITPFFGAALTSNYRAIKAFKDDPIGATFRALLYITLPTLLLWLFNRDNPFYDELPQWRKDGFWNFPNYFGPVNSEGHVTTFISLPIPHLVGFAFKIFPERVLESILEEDERAFEGIVPVMTGMMTPNVFPAFPLPLVENLVNMDTFTGRPIVPMREQALVPELQFGPHTSEVAKLIGSRFNLSPRQIDNIILGYMPGLGRLGLSGADQVLEWTGVADPVPKTAGGIRGIPVVGDFIAVPGFGGSFTMDRFYRDFDEAERLNASINLLLEQGKSTAPIVNELDERQRNNLSLLTLMRSINDELSTKREQVRNIHADLNKTPEQKRTEIDKLELDMINLVRIGYGKEPIPR